MPTHDRGSHPLVDALQDAFSELCEAGEIDVVTLEVSNEVEVQADAWTLQVTGWPVASAFIALDEEPVSLAERRHALDAAIDTRHLAALRHADAVLDGAIARGLEASGDPLSTLLAGALGAGDERADPVWPDTDVAP